MRRWLIMISATAALAACSCNCPAPQPMVVVPQGAAVVCPNGSPAVVSGGAYRC